LAGTVDNVKVSYIHVEAPDEIKKRLAIYCVKERVYQKEVVLLALEMFLDSMENKQEV
jgi:hypothetical protein